MQQYDLNDIVLYEGNKFKVIKVHHYVNAYEQGWVYAYDLEYCDTHYYPLEYLDYILQRKLSLVKKYLSHFRCKHLFISKLYEYFLS